MHSVYVPMVGGSTKGKGLYSDDPLAMQILGTSTNTSPRGTKRSPGITCKQLAQIYPNLKDEMYWIDPNGHDILDAAKVYCKISSSETCVEATTPEYDEDADEEITYNLKENQLSFLKLHSSSARQTVSTACISNSGPDTGNSTVFMQMDNGVWLKQEHPSLRYETILNSCGDQSTGYRITYKVEGPADRFPVRELVLPPPLTSLGPLQVGQVCFE